MFEKLENLTFKNEPIKDIINGPDEVMQHFNAIFPEVAKSNETGLLDEDTFSLWEPSKNSINIELDTYGADAPSSKFDVYLGGPATACAAALHAKSGIL